MGLLTLVPMYLDEHRDDLPVLADRLSVIFKDSIQIRPPWFDPEVAFDPVRGQYNSTTLLELLLTEPDPKGDRILGITGGDLFIPILTYVFGEAQLKGRAAVVSLHRLQNELYGLEPDARLTIERLIKESVHELGHTLGLIHCRNETCVMRSSTYVEEIDLKADEMCESCANRVT